MTATALRGHPSTDPRRPERATNPMREVHPDVLAVARDLGVTRPRTITHLQKVYDQMIADSIDGLYAYALTYLDPTGERATNRALHEARRKHDHQGQL